MTVDIKTLFFAPPPEAFALHARLEEAGANHNINFMFVSMSNDMADADQLSNAINSDYQLIVVHQSVQGFTTEFVRRLVNERGKNARVVAVWASEIGDTYDRVAAQGGVAYLLPYHNASFENLAANMETLLSQARERFQTADPGPEPLPEQDYRAERPVGSGGSRIDHRTITAWTSKGGEGKSEITSGLAYVLAMLGGRKTLLVDADMNRGYFGLITNQEARSFAHHKNITALGNLFYQTGQFPKLEEFVYNYPNPFTGGASQLDILFGTRSAAQATSTAFNYENARTFVDELISRTRSGSSYEVVIFDIGTLIQHPIHTAVLDRVANILILTAPNPGSFIPTARGIEDMLENNLVALDKMKLVVNTYSKGSMLKVEDIREYFYFGNPRKTFPHVATLPAVERDLINRVLALTMLSPEAWLTDPKEFDGLGELVRQYINLGSVFYSELPLQAAKTNSRIAELLGEQKTGIFGRSRRKK